MPLVMAYIAMTYIVMAYIVMAYIVMAYIEQRGVLQTVPRGGHKMGWLRTSVRASVRASVRPCALARACVLTCTLTEMSCGDAGANVPTTCYPMCACLRGCAHMLKCACAHMRARLRACGRASTCAHIFFFFHDLVSSHLVLRRGGIQARHVPSAPNH